MARRQRIAARLGRATGWATLPVALRRTVGWGVLAGVPLQNSVTQGATQAIEDRSVQQESLDACGLLVQDFFNQIVQHEVVTAGERIDKAGDIFMSLH